MKTIIVSDSGGREVVVRNLRKTAEVMGIHENTLRKRVADGNWIHREGFVPVRVRAV